jgi:hypothetical protein
VVGRTNYALRAGYSCALSLALAACSGAINPTTNTDLSATPGKPSASLSSSSNVVTSGAAATLTWSATDATSCTASGGWSGPLSTSGSQSTGALASNTTYTITCSGAGGTSTPASATVNVIPTASLSANPMSVPNGGSSSLSWSSTNAARCSASGGWSGTLAANGSVNVGPLTSGTNYSIVCSGAGGSSTAASVSVGILGAATASLTANPTTVAKGGSSTLVWSSTNASTCTASGGWSGTLAPSGSQSTGPISSTTTYSISCSGPGGASPTASATVTVTPVPTASISANPTVVSSGGSSTLTWSSSNATSCTASGGWAGPLATSGSKGTGALANTTTYSINCSGPGGTSATVSATVTVSSGSMAVSPTVAALTQSQAQQFTATVPGGGGASWTVDGFSGGSSAVGLIDSTGLYTPGSTVGAHTIVATSNANNSQSASAQVYVTDLTGVFTYHNDAARQGANTQEYALSSGTLSASTFGKLFSCTVDGAVYAQPLWAAGLVINGKVHNVVFVATAHDGLYAFDADGSPCVTLWNVNLIDGAHGAFPGETTVPSGTSGHLVGWGDGDITPEVGVIGTPVIDPAAQILYVVSKSVSSDHSSFYQRLHAIDILTGQEKSGSPTDITVTYPGIGDGGNMTTFSPKQENQRSGLALVNGTVYIAWASHEDRAPYYGWIAGYSYTGSGFNPPAVLNVTPDKQSGGIWMGGGAPASDGSYLYLLTGNGWFTASNASAPNHDYGDSLLKLNLGLTVADYFTPADQDNDRSGDNDFGSGGTAVLADLPSVHLILGGGKDGDLYLLNRDSLGGYGVSPPLQKVATSEGLFMTGAYWNYYFYLAGTGVLKAYHLTINNVPDLTIDSSTLTNFYFPGATPSVSANGIQNGIVWALDNHAYCTHQSTSCGPAVLHAYDATNVAKELWNSSGAGDAAGNAVKFTVPTVANGHVYVGTRGSSTTGYGSGELDVYGLKSN